MVRDKVSKNYAFYTTMVYVFHELQNMVLEAQVQLSTLLQGFLCNSAPYEGCIQRTVSL